MLSIDEEARKRFEEDWLSGRSLSIKEYLPSDQSATATYLGTLEELVCIDLEFRWRQGDRQQSNSEQTVSVNEIAVPTRVEDYVREFPELEEAEILTRLIEQEIFVRGNAGYVVDPGEYRARFPSITLNDSLFLGITSDEGNAETEEEFPRQFGPYVLKSLLGRGGMGSVYRAEQPQAGRHVALKVAELGSVPANARALICQRFQTEAHAAAGLVHDHAVPIFDVGVFEGQPYYAMRLVEGGDLGQRSKQEPLPPKEAAHYMLGISKCIAQAHAKGMLHRDIKPQNILVEAATGRAMLTDFGLARFQEGGAGLTQTGQLLGTPSFMPPEQIKDSSRIDGRADIYSLGATLYQLLTGKPPFRAAEIAETLRQVSTEDPVSPQTLNRAIDADLDTICLKCLEKDPEARYTDANALADDLQAFLNGQPIQARPVTRVRKLMKWAARNRKLAAAMSVAVTAILAALIASLTGYVLVQKENERNQRTLSASISGLQELTDRIENEAILSSPGMADVRTYFFSSIRDTYSDLAVLFEENPAAQLQEAVARVQVAKLDIALSKTSPETEQYITSALRMLDQQPESDPEILFAKGEALLQLSLLQGGRGDNQAGLNSVRSAVEAREAYRKVLEAQDAPPEEVLEARRKVASAKMNQGLFLRRLEKYMESAQLQVAAQEERQALVAAIQQKPGGVSESLQRRVLRDQAKGDFNLSILALQRQDVAMARGKLEQAEQSFRELLTINKVDESLYKLHAQTRIQLAGLLDPTNESNRTEKLVKSALSDVSGILQLNRNETEFSIQLLDLYQKGLEVLISRKLTDVESAYATYDQHFEDVASLVDKEDIPSMQALSILQLHATAGKALVSRILDEQLDPKFVLQTLNEALEKFSAQSELVSAIPKLQYDRQVLQRNVVELNEQLAADAAP